MITEPSPGLTLQEWDTSFLPCRLSRRFEFGKVWAKQFISSFFYFKIFGKAYMPT